MNWKLKLILAEIGILAASMLVSYVIMGIVSEMWNVSLWEYVEFATAAHLTLLSFALGSYFYIAHQLLKMLNK